MTRESQAKVRLGLRLRLRVRLDEVIGIEIMTGVVECCVYVCFM